MENQLKLLLDELNDKIIEELDRLKEITPNTMEYAVLAAEIENSKVILLKYGKTPIRKFVPTHCITVVDEENNKVIKDYFIMLVDGLAYTKKEWMEGNPAMLPDWSLSSEGTWVGYKEKVYQGTWCFKGKPFVEKGLRLACAKFGKPISLGKMSPGQSLQQWYDDYLKSGN